jgi:hypothetical protein
MKRSSLLPMMITAILVCPRSFAAQEGETLQVDQRVQRKSESYRAQHAAAAIHTEEALPYFDARNESSLVLTSAVNQTTEVRVVARFPDGRALPLGDHLVLPSRHSAIDLKALLEAADPTFRHGSLWISYLGTPETIQAWVVSRVGLDATELPLIARSDNQSRHYVSFWGKASARSASLALHVLNVSPRPLRYVVWNGTTPRKWREIGAEQSHRIVLGGSQRNGWLQIEHQGELGDLLVQVNTVSSPFGGKVPVWPLPTGYGSDFEALRIDLLRGSRVSTTLWNSRDEAQVVEVTAKDWASGEVISRTEVSVPSQAVRELSWSEWGHQQRAIRLQVSAEKAGLVVHGTQEIAGWRAQRNRLRRPSLRPC